MSVAPEIVVFTSARLSFTNVATSPSAVASSDSAEDRSLRSPASVVEVAAKLVLNCFTSASFAASADTKVCSCRTVANRLLRVARQRLRSAWTRR